MISSLPNIWRRKHLLWVLTTSNLKRQNKNTVLGYFWWLLDPILFTFVYYLLVAVLFKRGGSNQPFLLFVLCGMLSYKAFSDSISQSINILSGQAGIIRAISFPKIVLPLSVVTSNTVFFLFALVVAVGLSVWYGPAYGTWPSFAYIMLPVVLGLQVMFTAGIAFVMAAIGVLFKDTSHIMSHLLRVWFFLSPGLYSLDRVPEKWQPFFRFNPFCELMTAYRDIIMFGRLPETFDLIYAFGIGLVTCVAGFYFFRRLEGRLVQKL